MISYLALCALRALYAAPRGATLVTTVVSSSVVNRKDIQELLDLGFAKITQEGERQIQITGLGFRYVMETEQQIEQAA